MTSEASGSDAIGVLLLAILEKMKHLRDRGENKQALELASNLLREIGEDSHLWRPGDVLLAWLASLASNAFSAALALGDTRVALQYAEQELSFANQDGEDYGRARAFNNRGLARHESGELAAAESDYLAAIKLIDGSPDERLKLLRPSVANNLGQLRITRGQRDVGMQDLMQSTLLPTPASALAGAQPDIVQLNNRGFVAMNAGDSDAAEAAWKQALAVTSSRSGDAAIRGILACNLAELYHRAGRRSQAIEYYHEAIRIHTNDPGSKMPLAIDYNNLALLHQQAGDRDKALESFKQAWDSVRAAEPRSLVALHALRGIAIHRMLQRDMKRARAALTRGIDLYEQMRPAIAVTEPGHTGFLNAYRWLLEIAMYLAVHESWPEELLGHIERAKARFSQERIAMRPSVEMRADREGPTLWDPKLTGFNALMLNYFVGPNTTFVSYAYNRSLGAARIDAGEGALSDLVQAFRDDLMSSSRRAGQGEAGQKLSQLLFGKVDLESGGRCRHIHVMPDGPLWYLPFDALPAPEWLPAEDGLTPIGAVTPVSYAPSVSVLVALRDRDKELADCAAWRLLATGEPNTSDDFAPLSGTALELKNLQTLASSRLEVTVLRRETATKKHFLTLLPAYTHIHIASHAVADLETEDPYVLFSGIGAERFLRTKELLDSHMNAQLVFLSACSTSVGKSSTGEGLTSIARAFLWAGCRCVVATLWPVDDRGAPEFVRLFYRGLLSNLSVAEAARVAREQFRGEKGTARTWAAFQVFGDADRWEDRHSLEDVD